MVHLSRRFSAPRFSRQVAGQKKHLHDGAGREDRNDGRRFDTRIVRRASAWRTSAPVILLISRSSDSDELANNSRWNS